MKTIVLAYHNIGCAGIKALLKNGFEIAAVFTHKDDPKETIWFGSVAALAASYNIPVFAPDDINHPIWVKKIRDLAPDILFSFYYRNIIKPSILEIPPKGCLNLHGSLLPEYRGRSPINWAILKGETECGATLHYMTPRPDDGDIVSQTKVDIAKDDTAKSVFDKLTGACELMLADVLPQIKAGKAQRTPQDHSQATYYGGRRPEDGEIAWNESAAQIKNLVRAVTYPYPGAFSFIGNRKCIIWSVAEVSGSDLSALPGTILSVNPLTVACSKGAVRIDFGQPESGVHISGVQLASELKMAEGMSFGPCVSNRIEDTRRKSVLILGVDGFIGNALTERLLKSGKYEVHGMDLRSGYIQRFMNEPRFHFHEGDISIHREWIEYHIRKCDIVLPLIAIATPIEYTRNPLRVFELDFEENLRVVRYCVKYQKRIIFPSTSEVYGMCD